MIETHVNQNGTLETNDAVTNPVIKALAVFFSYIFHPLLLIIWVCFYLLYINETVFLGDVSFERLKVLLRVLGTSVFLPMVTVLLLKGLGFIDSIQLRTQKERIIPYVACITFFFWSYYVSKKLEDPLELRAFLLALFICASASLLINNYIKVSMHAMGAGGLLCLFIILLFTNKLDESASLVAAIVTAGLICTSRFIASDHKSYEIYIGFFVGLFIQLICFFIAR